MAKLSALQSFQSSSACALHELSPHGGCRCSCLPLRPDMSYPSRLCSMAHCYPVPLVTRCYLIWTWLTCEPMS